MNSLKLKMTDLRADDVKNIMDDKMQDVLSFFQNIFGFFITWLDDVFPPGTRLETLKDWILVAAPYLILGLVLLLCLPCILGIFRCFFRMFAGIFKFFFNIVKGIWVYLGDMLCCCCRGANKMMKGPGTNVNIVRALFEANPAGYFGSLRAGLPITKYM